MARTPLQKGPAKDHYHNTLGVDEQELGAAQTVSLLGPFHVAWDTPGIYGGSPTVELVPLTQGTIVVRAWAVISEAFNGLNDEIVLHVTIAGDLDNPATFAHIDAEGALGAGGYVGILPLPSDAAPGTQELIGVAVGSGDKLSVSVNADVPPTTGEADIYALIATPA